MCPLPAHLSGIWLQILGLTGRMHSCTSEAAIAAKILWNPGGRCTSVLAGTPKKQACGTAFDPSQLHERDATEPHIRLNVYHADALPREPIRIVRGQPEQTVAWPKHGVFIQSAQRSALTGGHRALRLQSREIYYRSRDHPNAHELTNHIRHPSPAPGLRSPGAPEKALRMLCGIVPVSPTGTKGSLPRIFWMGTTYRIGFL